MHASISFYTSENSIGPRGLFSQFSLAVVYIKGRSASCSLGRDTPCVYIVFLHPYPTIHNRNGSISFTRILSPVCSTSVGLSG